MTTLPIERTASTLRKVKSILRRSGLLDKVELGGRGSDWNVEAPDGTIQEQVSDALRKAGINVGGYRTGYGAWVLSESYQTDDYDFNNPASRSHYASDHLPVETRTAASFFDMFFKEKNVPYKVFDVTDSQGITHSIPNEVVINMIKQTRGREKAKIEETLRMIDFKNGDVNHYLQHLARGLAEQYSGTLRFASEQQAEKFEAEAEAAEAQAEADRQKADASRLKAAGLGPVAQTILDQMGGNRVLAMLGVNRLVDLRNGIGIGWPNRQRSKGNYVEIMLNGKDLYDMTFYNLSMRGKKKVKEFKDLYNDSLADTFEGQTGWYLRMASDKAAAGGLYGYTKGTQRDVEASIRKAQRRAASIAKTLYAKDERSVDFLKAHAKRANSKTARLILAAMKTIGPRVASETLPSERHASIYHASEQEQLEYVVDALRLAGEQGLRVDGLPRKGALAAQSKGLADAERGYLYITRKGRNVRMAAEEKVAGGLYGYPTKTARLALVACSDLRAYVGEVAYGLHSRRTARYDRITGFLKEHGKTAKCAYSRMILDCYPDAPVSKQAKEEYPWPECIADQEKQYGSKETAEKVCGKIKAQSQGKSAGAKDYGIMGGKLASSEMLKKAFVPDSVDGWLEWEDGSRTAATRRRG